jgi:exopolyphosphatase/guanosine-5'-triphosphate,3'-diphosphate pyrophosphatase
VIGAAVDVGSNSAHLLVAEVDGHGVRPLDDESVFLGLGERVAAVGHLGSTARDAVAETLARYASAARDLGAARVTFIGTEPVRRATDGARLAAVVEAASGAPLFVLGHEEEAWLNLLGVTGGRQIGEEMAVVDSGGGSTEVVTISPDGRHEARAVRIGSAVLTASLVRSDPPRADELRALRPRPRRSVRRSAPDTRASSSRSGGRRRTWRRSRRARPTTDG